MERIQKRALKVIYKEVDYDKCLQIAELVSLKERRDQMRIQLSQCQTQITNCTMYCPRKSMKLEIGKRGRIVICIIISNGELNVLKTAISYAISKYNETFFV